MRTKVILSIAALAAGVATSMAQSNVYSLNIVGYINVALPNANNALANQLNKGTPQNRADQVIPYSDTDSIQIWNGVSFTSYFMDSGSSTGWSDAGGGEVQLVNLPVLAPGKGFFYGKNSTITNITFVGEVALGTNNVTITSSPRFSMLGSPIPYSGLIRTVNANNQIGCPVPDANDVQKWSVNHWVASYADSGSSTGWTDAGGGEVPEPTLAVGEGFFYENNSGAPITWTQILNNP